HGGTGQGARRGLWSGYGHLVGARPAAANRHQLWSGGATRGESAAGHRAVIARPGRSAAAWPAGTRGVGPAELRTPTMRRRWSAVAEFVDSHRPQAGRGQRVDLGAGEGPRGPVVGFADLVAGARDNQQRSAGRYRVADVRDCVAPGRI